MWTKSRLLELFGPRAQIRVIDLASSGSPARLEIRIPAGPFPNTARAAEHTGRRHSALRDANICLEEALDHGRARITLPVVTDTATLIGEREACGIEASVVGRAEQAVGDRQVA